MQFLGVGSFKDQIVLANGIKPTWVNEQGFSKYYFPVLSNNTVVCVIVVNEINGTLGFTILNDELTAFFNSANRLNEEPVRLVVDEESIYEMTSTTLTEVCTGMFHEGTEQALTFDDLSQLTVINNEIIVSIDETSSLMEGRNAVAPFTIVGRSLDNFPLVNNVNGTCWASTTAAMIEYILNGSLSSQANAYALRDAIVASNGSTGSIDTAQNYIQMYTGRYLTKTANYLAWAMIKQQILEKNNPCYMSLYNSVTTNYHATALIGYDYDNYYTSAYRMYLMDPNVTSGRVIVSYGNVYSTSYGYVYTWEKLYIGNRIVKLN